MREGVWERERRVVDAFTVSYFNSLRVWEESQAWRQASSQAQDQVQLYTLRYRYRAKNYVDLCVCICIYVYTYVCIQICS